MGRVRQRLASCVRIVGTPLGGLRAQTTQRGAGMMVLLVVVVFLAFATGEGVLYRLSCFLALVLVGSYVWTRLNLARLDMRVEEQSSVAQVGDILNGSIYVCNNSPLPASWVEIVQASDMPGDVCGGATQLPPRGWEAWRTERFCHARGVYTIGPLVARSSDPLGLFSVERSQGDPIEVMIYPAVSELPGLRLPAVGLSGEERVLRRPQTRSAQASTVREYSYGDSLSRIHWPSTAKWDQLMSKEFDSGGYGDVWVILDLEQAVQEAVGMEKTDECAVAAAASLAHLALAEERSVGLVAYGDQEYVLPPGSGPRQMSRVLETLAIAKTEGDATLREVLRLNTVRFGRLASVLIVTSSTDTEWVAMLQNLSFRGLKTMVVLVDPESFGGDRSCYAVAMALVSAGIPVHVVRRGDMLPVALSRPANPRDLHMLEQDLTGELASPCEA